MAWSFVAAGTPATGAMPTVPLPTYNVGNLLLLVVASKSANATATPVGYTSLASLAGGTGSAYFNIYYKFAGASETAPSVAISAATTIAVILSYSGVSSLDIVGATNDAHSTTAVTTSTTTTAANDLVFSIYSGEDGSFGTYTWSVPTGTTNRVNVGGSATPTAGLLICDENQASAGATAARTSTISGSKQWGSVTIAFKQNLVRSGGSFLQFF